MNNLQRARKIKGLTQAQVAKLINVDRSTYTRYESGEIQPDNDKLRKLAAIFESSSDYLLGINQIGDPLGHLIPLLGTVLVIVPYTEADIKAMLASCQKRKPYILPGQRETATDFPEGLRLKTSLLLLLDTGIRASEYCGLRFKDVDLRNKNIIVLGKGRKERQIPVSSRTSQVLWTYFSTRPDMLINSPAFATANDTQIHRDNFLKSIYRLGERSGVQNPTIHRFRHTFAINFLRNGGDIYTLQRILGHSTLDMVKRYLSIAQVDIQAAHRRASPVTNWGL